MGVHANWENVICYRPRKAVAEILNIFGDSKNGWSTSLWFAGLNSFLDDERPPDLLATAPEQVVAAAMDEMAEMAHGYSGVQVPCPRQGLGPALGN